MAGMCPQYAVYWCPLQNGCPGVPKKEVMGEIYAASGGPFGKKEIPYCIIAHNAAASAVMASDQIGIPHPQMAVDFLKAEASKLWE